MRKSGIGVAVAVALTAFGLLHVAAPAAGALRAPVTAAFFDSEPGDHLGLGAQIAFNSVVSNGNTGGSPGFTVSNGVDQFVVDFAGPVGSGLLGPGVYEGAGLTSSVDHPALFLVGDGRGCTIGTGRFVVDDATYSPSGAVQTFSARFEEHCQGFDAALFGVISYQSTAEYRTRSISPGVVNLTSSGGPVSQVVTITDNGPSSLDLTGFAISGPGGADFSIAMTSCTGAIAPGGSCRTTVTYTPGQNLSASAMLSFTDELAPAGSPGEADGAGTGRTIALSGTSAGPRPQAAVSLSTTSIQFPPQRVGTYGAVQAVTLTNSGQAPLHMSSIDLVGDYLDYFASTNCPQTVTAGGSCVVDLWSTPTTTGPRPVRLQFFNDAIDCPQSVEVGGTGTEGYFIAGSNGEVGTFGDAPYFGDLTNVGLNAPIIGVAAIPNGAGYWLLGKDGGVFNFGYANFYGSVGGMHLNAPARSMTRTQTGNGYWVVASDGGIFSFGDARFYGSTGAIHLNAPIAGMAVTPTGHGYWLVASDGGIFTFGDARFYGSTGAIHLNAPIAGMAVTPTGHGYWLVASDGGIFTFGDAPFLGSLGGAGFTDVIGMAGTAPPLDPNRALHAQGLAVVPYQTIPSQPRQSTAIPSLVPR